jgi:hypothetical protein
MGTDAPALSGVLVVMLVNLRAGHRGWGWHRLMRGPRSLGPQPGLLFCKLMGSGAGGGFGLKPSVSHQGLLALFGNDEQARAFCASPLLQDYQERSEHAWVGRLSIISARGAWDGHAWRPTSRESLGHAGDPPAVTPTPAATGPLAAITRASIRPSQALHFWRQAPAAQAQMAGVDGCLLAVGLGEAPVLRQCTFSIWSDLQAMRAYAGQGAHRQAVEQVQARHLFSESLFLRLQLLAQTGHWPTTALRLMPAPALAQTVPEALKAGRS